MFSRALIAAGSRSDVVLTATAPTGTGAAASTLVPDREAAAEDASLPPGCCCGRRPQEERNTRASPSVTYGVRFTCLMTLSQGFVATGAVGIASDLPLQAHGS